MYKNYTNSAKSPGFLKQFCFLYYRIRYQGFLELYLVFLRINSNMDEKECVLFTPFLRKANKIDPGTSLGRILPWYDREALYRLVVLTTLVFPLRGLS